MNKKLIPWRVIIYSGIIFGVGLFAAIGGSLFSAVISGLIASTIAAWIYGKWGIKFSSKKDYHSISLGVAITHMIISIILGLNIFIWVTNIIIHINNPELAEVAFYGTLIPAYVIVISATISALVLYLAYRISFMILGGRKK